MTFFPSLGAKTTVPDILRMNPHAGKAQIEMHEVIMRGPSALSPGQRELIAAYVSGINECRYCHGVHSQTAKAYDDVSDDAIDRMLHDFEGAAFDDKIKPILRFARKLTEEPASISEADAQAVYDAGWDEKALHDAIWVICCFNFMNRLLESHGVHGSDALFRERGPLLKQHGYLPLIRLLKV